MTYEALSRRSLLAATAGFAGTALLSRPLGLVSPAAAATATGTIMTAATLPQARADESRRRPIDSMRVEPAIRWGQGRSRPTRTCPARSA